MTPLIDGPHAPLTEETQELILAVENRKLFG
jgi:hypothetical protein